VPLKESEVSKRWAGARLTDLHRNPIERFLTQGVNNFMKISELLTQQDLQTLICWLEDSLASRSQLQEKGLAQPMNEVICSLSLPESLKPSSLAILSLKTYPDCWVLKKGRLSKSSLKRWSTWGIAWNGLCTPRALPSGADSAGFGVPQSRKRVYLAGCLGVDCSGKILAFGNCDEENSRKVKQLIGGSQGQRVYDPDGLAVTQCSGSGGMGGKTGLYLIDMNYPPTLTEKARCITARQDSGVSKHKGEHSGVLVEDGPRAILNPFKEEVYQNGRRVKEPNEPMFTLTVVDRHGIVHQGRIRRLMPIECWRLQGFTTEQFRKVEAAGLSDAQLYKQAGNAVTVNVVEALARNLLKFDKEVRKCPTM